MSKSPELKSCNSARARLLSEAMELITLSGDLSFSLRDLARRADTSTMSVYSHFGSRDGLYRALAEQSFDHFFDALVAADGATPELSPLDQLYTMAQVYRSFAFDKPSHYELIFGGQVSFETFEPLTEQFDGLPSPAESGYRVYAMFAAVFEEGTAQGLFRTDMPQRIVRDIYWSQLHGLVALEKIGYVRSTDEAEERFGHGVRAVLDGLRHL